MPRIHTLRISLFSPPLALTVAHHLGLLRAAGLALEIERARGSRHQIDRLLAGDLDLVHTNPDNVMKYRGKGRTDLFIFLTADTGAGQTLLVGQDVQSWVDLRGRQVGVDAADSGYALVLYEMLRRQGIPRDTYEAVPLGSTAFRLEGLRGGEIAGCLVNHNHEDGAVKEGFKVLTDIATEFPGYPGSAMATTRASSEGNGPLLDAYVAVWLEAAAWIRHDANTEKLVAILSAEHECDHNDAMAMLALQRAAQFADVPDAAQTARMLAVVADLRQQWAGTVVDGYFDDSYMQAAAARQ